MQRIGVILYLIFSCISAFGQQFDLRKAPEPYFSTQELDFGSVAIRESKTASFFVTNLGDSSFSILDSQLRMDAYTSSLDSVTTIGPGDTTNILIQFTPKKQLPYHGKLHIFTDIGEYQIVLTGSGYELWPLEWRILADTTDWFGLNHAARSMAFSEKTNHLYIITRHLGSSIKILDAETGEMVSTIQNKHIQGGTYDMNAISATTDGQLFVCNLALSGESFKIYHFRNENANPEMIYEGSLDGRIGDAFTILESDKNIHIYASGSGNKKIYVFSNQNGNTFELNRVIELEKASNAGMNICPVLNGGYLFICGLGRVPRYIKDDGSEIKEFDELTAGTCLQYFKLQRRNESPRHFLAAINGYQPGIRLFELLGQPGDSLCTQYETFPSSTPTYANNPNSNATGKIVYNNINNSVIEMITNNGLSAYSFSKIEPNADVPRGSITGTIIASQTGDPIADAQVHLKDTDLYVTSDNQGEYGFNLVPVGHYDISVRTENYFTEEKHVNIVANQSTVVNFELNLKIFPPIGLKIVPQGPNAKLEWNLKRPDSKIAYHDGIPSSGLFQQLNWALGVVFDLTDMPQSTLEQIDFCHYAWGIKEGPYRYRVHVFNWDDSTKITEYEGITSESSFDHPAWELAVDLGSIPWIPHVGIFIEPLSGTLYDAHPALSTDNSIPANTGKNFIITDISSPFSTAQDLVVKNKGHGDFLIDLWINTPEGITLYSDGQSKEKQNELLENPKKTAGRGVIPTELRRSKPGPVVPTPTALKEYKLYRGKDIDNLNLLAAVSSNTTQYLDETVQNNQSYIYAIVSVFDLGESEKKLKTYTHPPFLDISVARKDDDQDYVPDHLGKTVTVGGIITTPNFTPGGQSNYFLQDSSAAINIFSHNLDFEDIHNLKMGDGIYVTGQIGQYRGLTELEIKNPLHLSVLSRDNTLPAVKSVTLADVNESLEAQLVEIEKVWLVNPDGWPKNNQNGTVYFTDGRDTLELFIDKDTNLDGWTAPENIFSVMGVVDQYTTHTPANNRYELRPRFQEDFAITSTVEQGNQMPMTFLLEQNQPNPFNPVTKIRIHLPVETEIQLDVYNILGNLVTTLFQGKIAAGRHVFYFKGNDLPTGTYFYRLTSDRFHSVKKMILLK